MPKSKTRAWIAKEHPPNASLPSNDRSYKDGNIAFENCTYLAATQEKLRGSHGMLIADYGRRREQQSCRGRH